MCKGVVRPKPLWSNTHNKILKVFAEDYKQGSPMTRPLGSVGGSRAGIKFDKNAKNSIFI